ncbi:MAG: hypothetical protein EA412_04430 [Chitinophagaceae bacterium]|nr:MAG: hypothetical protein EA412_04430 [Chitinophagaceae bacterium]
MKNILNKTVEQIILEDFTFAGVLHYFGVSYSEHLSDKIEQLCSEKKINFSLLEKQYEANINVGKFSFTELRNKPISQLLEVLKQSHYQFVKVRIPYINSLIIQNNIAEISNDDHSELRYLFDMFAMDFIHHVREEEEVIFDHVINMCDAAAGKYDMLALHKLLSKVSIQEEAIEHASPDEDMRFIREINDQYISSLQSGKKVSIELHVLFSEMKSFEKDLSTHSKIENEILFPRAIKLEKSLYKELSSTASLN